jgi:hypothetical protein
VETNVFLNKQEVKDETTIDARKYFEMNEMKRKLMRCSEIYSCK